MAYFAATGSAVVVTTGVPCATGTVGSTGGGRATGTRTCSVAPGAVPAGTVIRTVEPSEAFASMDSPSLAPVWKSRVQMRRRENLISAQRGTGRHGYAHDVRRLGPAQVRELPLELAEVADDLCGNQPVRRVHLGDGAAVLARSSGEEATPLSSRRRVDGVEVDATIQHERAVKL